MGVARRAEGAKDMTREQRIHERQRSARIHALGGYDKETFYKAAASSAEYLSQCMSLEKERDAYETRCKVAEETLAAVLRTNPRIFRAQARFWFYDYMPPYDDIKRELRDIIMDKVADEITYKSMEDGRQIVYTAELRLAEKEGRT